MSTRTGQDNHQDQEIIELTEVVEEPDKSTAAGPSAPGEQNGESIPSYGQTKVSNRPQARERRPASGEEDDFDFSSLMHEHQSSESSKRQKHESSPPRTWNQQAQYEDQEYDDLEDLFQELDLDLEPDQEGYLEGKAGGGGKASMEKQIEALRQRLEDLESHSLEQTSLQALESRIAQLEPGASSLHRETWKEVENRILNRLEDMVQEQITKARNAVHQEIETACQDRFAAREEEVRDLAHKVEEIGSYALGPETLSALKNELWTELSQRIEETVPQAAARIIRQEIQALREEEQKEQDLDRNVAEE